MWVNSGVLMGRLVDMCSRRFTRERRVVVEFIRVCVCSLVRDYRLSSSSGLSLVHTCASWARRVREFFFGGPMGRRVH